MSSGSVDLGSTFGGGGGGGGVTSLNSLTGALALVGGSGITITPAGSNITISSSASVSSVGLTAPVSVFSVSGSPVTTSGTLALSFVTQTANTVFAGPTSGGAATPTFRTLVSGDIPSLSGLYLPLAGGTMSGAINLGNNALNNVSNLAIGETSGAAATSIDIVNNTGATLRLVQTGYGGQVGFRGRYANGTLSSPTAATNGNILHFFSGMGYGTSTFPASSTGAINLVAGETFTNTSNATYLQFMSTPTGSVTSVESMRVNSTGNLLIGTTTDSGTQKLQVNGNSNVGTVTSGTWNGTLTTGFSFLTAGTTYTTPSNITTATQFKITLVGGGAAGGGSPTTTNAHGAGGGAGGTCTVYLTGLSPSTGYTMAIGAGGTGNSNASGNNGGNTTISINATTYTANGGSGGAATASTNGGAGGTATNGTINITGQNGGPAPTNTSNEGAGSGGSSLYGLGGQGPITASTGQAGSGYGAGGSGSMSAASGAAQTGGAGTQGMILVEWQN